MHASTGHISRQMLEAALSRYQGEILQTPPLYSALKLHGHRIADLTRCVLKKGCPPFVSHNCFPPIVFKLLSSYLLQLFQMLQQCLSNFPVLSSGIIK
jgi:hypothetical protein